MRKVWKKQIDRIPTKSWCEEIDDKAMEQAADLARHPVTFHHIALMPDTHPGYGVPIGAVIACENAIIPNAVGVDIGCGMVAVKTSYSHPALSEDQLKKIMGDVHEKVPLGFKHQKYPQEWDGWEKAPRESPIINKQLERAYKQLGTLGGGNHFIEIQRGDDGHIWIMIHSGSRNFGLQIANYYHKKAVKLCERWKSNIPNTDLAFLPIGEPSAAEYVKAMNFASAFAKENRARMMLHVKTAFSTVLNCYFEKEINIHHNYVRLEHHFGKNVWIHRKGATSAKKGELGIIPGSMGTPSYIVEGLGNPESFQSCSHGAGRIMGRAAASRNLSVEECDRAMEGVVFGRWGKDRKGRIDLGEAPPAYKNIENVIESQLDLIKPLIKLQPLAVIKG